jgi:hypothetical protein
MEQAKAIRMKRELAQELEDVVKFEKAHVSERARRSEAKTKKAPTKEDDSIFSDEESDGDVDDDGQAKKRAKVRVDAVLAWSTSEADHTVR